MQHFKTTFQKQGLDPRDALNDLELVLNVSQINFLLERLKEERIRRDRDDDILKVNSDYFDYLQLMVYTSICRA